ncbi:MAG: glycosyltransferase [Chloroflexota bacterium]|nr:glycosyltransferase [Chloroflexota bacterium]
MISQRAWNGLDLVCVSHLRWDFVWQRPQHLMQRLSQSRKVLFIEEPVAVGGDAEPELVVRQETPTIWVATLHVPYPEGKWIAFDSPWQEAYERKVAAWVRDWTDTAPVLWYYNPLPLGFIDALQPASVVYDVMDELRNFAVALPELVEREERLLSRADVVFTGGASIHRSKQPHNPNTHLFPSGVEVQHFLAAQEGSTPLPPDVAHLRKPRIGYYGVIDERLDLELIAALAGLRPEWEWLFIGSVLKIDESSLPEASNIHYLGQREYTQLPAYLKAFDVAMMPFALNEATLYISPTKTLEYMAGGKPIVSTPVPDVVELYGEGVRIARNAEEFVAECEAALAENAHEAARRQAVYKRLLAAHEWDDIAERMEELVGGTLGEPSAAQLGAVTKEEYADEWQQ